MPGQPLLSTVKKLVRTLTKFHVIGQHYIPDEGGLLLTTNHLSRLDTPFLMTITDRTDLVAIVAKKYQKIRFFKWVLERIGTMVWMDRENTDFSAIREAMTHMRSGMIVGIAPEGTRNRNSIGLMEGKQGAAVLAERANVPILPAGIIGSERVNHYWMRLKRPPVTIRVGEPYHLPPMDRENRQAWLTSCTDEIMCQIAALLPPEYRGVYAENPRVKEILAEQKGD